MTKVAEIVSGGALSLLIVTAGSAITEDVSAESVTEDQEIGVNWQPQSGKGGGGRRQRNSGTQQ